MKFCIWIGYTNTWLYQERYTIQRINDDTSKNVTIITDPLLLIHAVIMTAITGFGWRHPWLDLAKAWCSNRGPREAGEKHWPLLAWSHPAPNGTHAHKWDAFHAQKGQGLPGHTKLCSMRFHSPARPACRWSTPGIISGGQQPPVPLAFALSLLLSHALGACLRPAARQLLGGDQEGESTASLGSYFCQLKRPFKQNT